MGIENWQNERFDLNLRVRYGYATIDREGVAGNFSLAGSFGPLEAKVDGEHIVIRR